MNATTYMRKPAAVVLVAAAALALLAVPTASAGKTAPSGMVATSLGSQDPRDTALSDGAAGLVPSRLGSPDPRENVALGAQRTTAGTAQGSTQIPRGAALPTGPFGVLRPDQLARRERPDGGAQRAVFVELAAQASSSRAQVSSGQTTEVGSSNPGFSWRDAGIGGGAALLLVGLVGLGVATQRRKRLVHA